MLKHQSIMQKQLIEKKKFNDCKNDAKETRKTVKTLAPNTKNTIKTFAQIPYVVLNIQMTTWLISVDPHMNRPLLLRPRKCNQEEAHRIETSELTIKHLHGARIVSLIASSKKVYPQLPLLWKREIMATVFKTGDAIQTI